MSKLKTHGATIKRFKVTATGKYVKRVNGQDHFNSRESGRVTRNKRTDFAVAGPTLKGLKEFTPYDKK